MSDWTFDHKPLSDEKDPRIELRGTFKYSNWVPGKKHLKTEVNYFAQILVAVRKADNERGIPEVVISMNGKAPLNVSDIEALVEAIGEARKALQADQPYLEGLKVERSREYNPQYDPDFSEDKLCECGHTYYRHFDTYEDMYPCGCKYCGCYEFKEKK